MHWKLKNRQRALWYGVSASRNLKTISHKNQHSDTRNFLNFAKQIPGAHTLVPCIHLLTRIWWINLPANSPGRYDRGAGKGRRIQLQLRLWTEFEHLYRKSRCEMLIGGDDISNDVDACFSMFVYIRADWRKSDSSVEFKFQRRSWKEPPGESYIINNESILI